ncbi:hypothetical protein AB1N83_012212 [Pleurotus pulmonarius]
MRSHVYYARELYNESDTSAVSDLSFHSPLLPPRRWTSRFPFQRPELKKLPTRDPFSIPEPELGFVAVVHTLLRLHRSPPFHRPLVSSPSPWCSAKRFKDSNPVH